MSLLSLLLAIIVGFYAYQWGADHKDQPNRVVFIVVMALCLIVSVPAYYIGQHNREGK